MGLVESEAWVIHTIPQGEASYYVTFFTKKKGIVKALCRGVAKNSKKQSLLQPFIPLWICFTEKYNKFYVNNFELQGPCLVFSKNSLFIGLYVNEIIYNLLKDEDEYADLFVFYEQLLINLQNLSDTKLLQINLRKFEFKLLEIIGYGISLNIEFASGETVKQEKYYTFLPDKGMIVSQNGILGRYLLAVHESDFTDKITLKVAKYITNTAINFCLSGKVLKSKSLFKFFEIDYGN